VTTSPGNAWLTSSTARPAEKGASTERPDPALVRRTVDALVSLSGCRRKAAREYVAAWIGASRDLSDLERNLLGYSDPTGETAVRNVDRSGGAR
jgi:hypothetical protein